MHIEEKVNQILLQLNEFDIDLNIDEIAHVLDIFVVYNEHLSCYTQRRGHDIIYLKYDDKIEMWKTFTHELAHFFMHSTDQHLMPTAFNEKQENEANKFSLLFRMPRYIIQDNELYDEQQLANYFNEDLESARKRLNILLQEMSSGAIW
ncbi:hypothetical protein BU643_06240 [Staphylococcus chromogenes]|uniref:ImmA/IrrE family metallo-endopeptidase n=1 Tax=Staphylococcus chromogenes TaxID=46126 RepID=UPI000D1BA7C9|nr:ImmA/IrrE family metallo-endopeptidase [Staphylococcus chromogenes]PTG93686.1 hypothetical protein BU643_06240 [Staphylococcus chromogenes]